MINSKIRITGPPPNPYPRRLCINLKLFSYIYIYIKRERERERESASVCFDHSSPPLSFPYIGTDPIPGPASHACPFEQNAKAVITR